MSSLQAYCVKCQSLTEPMNPQTVTLQNQSRALKGSCRNCSSDVFRFLTPRNEKSAEQPSKSSLAPTLRSTPDAYCVKCHAKTVALDKKTVILKSNRRALRGTCQQCHSEVYKFLPITKKDAPKDPNRMGVVSLHVMSRHPSPIAAARQRKSNTLWIGLSVVGFAAAASLFVIAGAKYWQPLMHLIR